MAASSVAEDDDALLVSSSSGTSIPQRVVKPYIMDLESTNGTQLNGKLVEPARWVNRVVWFVKDSSSLCPRAVIVDVLVI